MKPKKYRSKPVEIEAILFDGSNASEIVKWSDYACCIRKKRLIIKSISGNVYPKRGHYIIKGAEDFYPCSPKTFKERWELVE